MKAAYLQNNLIQVGEVPDPVPAKGQALVRTHSCGLCASDARHAIESLLELLTAQGAGHARARA